MRRAFYYNHALTSLTALKELGNGGRAAAVSANLEAVSAASTGDRLALPAFRPPPLRMTRSKTASGTTLVAFPSSGSLCSSEGGFAHSDASSARSSPRSLTGSERSRFEVQLASARSSLV